MRNLSPALAAHLASGATTLAHCWRITRRDGAVFGFTDHDRDLTFSGVTYQALSGLDSTQTESSLGLAVGGAEISGALMSESLQEADFLKGLYDGAQVEVWIVNWSDVTQRHLLDAGAIGEITRRDGAFAAEVRSLAHAFDQARGRLFQAGCPAELGDAACRIPLTSGAWSVSSTIVAATRRDISSMLGVYEQGWFVNGVVHFTSGVLSGVTAVVKQHDAAGAMHRLAFASPLASAPQPGDSITAKAGCDKSFRTCGEKFSNQKNFRGFPHMPGNDVVTAYPQNGDAGMDGGSLFR